MFFFALPSRSLPYQKVVRTERRTKQIHLFFYAEAKPTLSKDSARRARVYQNAIFFRCRDVACRVSITSIIHKMLNIKQFDNPVVEGVSKCDFFRCRDVACRTGVPKKV